MNYWKETVVEDKKIVNNAQELSEQEAAHGAGGYETQTPFEQAEPDNFIDIDPFLSDSQTVNDGRHA